MTLLILGLVLFLGMHLVPVLTPVRNRLFGALGENRYKGMFSLVSAVGLVLIVLGYARAPGGARLFDPVAAAIAIAPPAMLVSFVLLAAANMNTHIRRAVRHPMLIGVGIWAALHLLANGHAKATVLFGAFLGYVIVDLMSAVRRHAVKTFTPAVRQDAIAVVAGTVLALLAMAFHRTLFGVAPVGWSM